MKEKDHPPEEVYPPPKKGPHIGLDTKMVTVVIPGIFFSNEGGQEENNTTYNLLMRHNVLVTIYFM